MGASPDAASASASTAGIWDSTRKALKVSAPIRMRKIIPVTLAVSRRPSENVRQRSRPAASATTEIAAAPIAAASVGVNTPRYMPPTTAKKMAATSHALLRLRTRSRNGMAGAAGPAAGFSRTYAPIAAQYPSVAMMPGTSAARNSLPIDCSVMTP